MTRKGSGSRYVFVAERDPPLLHGFEQRALHRPSTRNSCLTSTNAEAPREARSCDAPSFTCIHLGGYRVESHGFYDDLHGVGENL